MPSGAPTFWSTASRATRTAASKALPSDGWEITYKSVKTKRASWSGTKDERIFYAHGAAGCDGQAAYFQFDYDASAKDDFDPIIKRMVKSFSAKGECL